MVAEIDYGEPANPLNFSESLCGNVTILDTPFHPGIKTVIIEMNSNV